MLGRLMLIGVLAAAFALDCPADNDAWTKWGGKCYAKFDACASHAGCSKVCGDRDAALVCVESQAENDFLNDQFGWGGNRTTRKIELPDEDTFWIGAYQEDRMVSAKAGWTKWANGCASNYTYWAPGEPNWYAGKEQCVAMPANWLQSDRSGGWFDAPCSLQKPCLCQYLATTTDEYMDDHNRLGGKHVHQCFDFTKIVIAVSVIFQSWQL